MSGRGYESADVLCSCDALGLVLALVLCPRASRGLARLVVRRARRPDLFRRGRGHGHVRRRVVGDPRLARVGSRVLVRASDLRLQRVAVCLSSGNHYWICC